MTGDFVIKRLSRDDPRAGFTCGVASLDRYLRERAGQDERKHVAHCFVAVSLPERQVAGYYTLSATSIPSDAISEAKRHRLPLYPRLPAALIGRLAVDERYRGMGLGAAMIIDAGQRALQSDAAFYALVVDAKDEAAAAFYRYHQFEAFIGEPLSLFIPLATMQDLMSP